MNIPIFPLPIFILPGGVSRIRVFEPRYLKMVAIAMKNQGFAVLPYSKVLTIDVSNIASHVDIINFNQEDDGTLIIDVKCKSLVNIGSMTTDTDGLRHADIVQREHWQNEFPYTNLDITSDIYQTIHKQYDHLQELYQSPDYQNDIWIVSRWIELLPIDLEVKVAFFESDTFPAACQLLDEILLKKKSDPKQTR
jgi:Lon protease-like protein